MFKPEVLILSSGENLEVARAIQTGLHRDANTSVWDQGFVKLARHTLDSLLDGFSRADFGVFVLAPEDATRLRNENVVTVRDNVILELGICMGALGKNRTFIVAPDNVDAAHFPTDLDGITMAHYDGGRDDYVAALGPACSRIRQAISESRHDSGAPADRIEPWRRIKAILEPPPASDQEIEERIDRLILTSAEVTGQKKPKTRIWGNERYLDDAEQARFRLISQRIGFTCARLGYPLVGSIDDPHTAEYWAFKGAAEFLSDNADVTDDHRFYMHYDGVLERKAPDFSEQRKTETPARFPNVVPIPYPFPDMQKQLTVSKYFRSECFNTLDARLGSLLQCDVVIFLSGKHSVINAVEILNKIERARLRISAQPLVIPVPWVKGAPERLFHLFEGMVSNALIDRLLRTPGE